MAFWDVIDNALDTSVPKLLEQPTEMRSENNAVTHVVEIEEDKIAKGLTSREVIDLSDDDVEENAESEVLVERQVTELKSMEWHYADPQGDIQGPFSIASLKRWSDADYFPRDFKVWKTGEGQEKAVLLFDILQHHFAN